MNALKKPLALLVVTGSIALVGCKSTAPTAEPIEAPTAANAVVPAEPAGAEPAAGPAMELKPGSAVLGAPAPDFELTDTEGAKVRLSQHKGKVVVLEWFNPECPFVKNSHTVGSLVGTAARHEEAGVVWLAINSGAPGKQGHGAEKNREAKASFKLPHPVLLDESGKVGKAYGAERTPEMFVIASSGELVYRGAIDNSPDGEKQSPEGGKLVNYVDEAVLALKTGAKPAVAQTKSYGCSVKYAD